MSGWNRFFLVLLRLVIGWHLLFAGIEKFRKDTWSSEGYLRESYGPLASPFRWVAGDVLLDRMTPLAVPDDFVAGKSAALPYFPPALAAEWDAYFEKFCAHYSLDEAGRAKAKAKLDEQKEATARWLIYGTKFVKRTPAQGPAYEAERTTSQRVEEYRAKVQEARNLQDRGEADAYRSDLAEQVQKVRRDTERARADAGRLRSELRADLDEQTEALKLKLEEALTPAQREEASPRKLQSVRWKQWDRWREWSLLDWNDALVACGLTGIGALLLAGLFTRTACVLGALFLLGFYVAAPALLGVPEALRNEGYPFINKNIVEAVTLLALATFPTGYWAGLDAILYFLNPFNWRRLNSHA